MQSSRQLEQELRSQINVLLNGERQAKGDIQQLQHDNDQLQSKWVLFTSYFYGMVIITNLCNIYKKI